MTMLSILLTVACSPGTVGTIAAEPPNGVVSQAAIQDRYRFYESVTIEMYFDDDLLWAPAAVALALGYKVVRFDKSTATFRGRDGEITVPMRDLSTVRWQFYDPWYVWPRYVPVSVLAMREGFWLEELTLSRDPGLAQVDGRIEFARFMVAKYRRFRTVDMAPRPRRWFLFQQDTVALDKLKIQAKHATFGRDEILLDPERIKWPGWSDRDPTSFDGLYSLEVLFAGQRTDGRREPRYTLPESWVARFALGRQSGVSSMMRGYNYGTVQRDFRSRWSSTSVGWDPYDDPDEPKLTRAAFWAPAAARPVALEYFDGYRHVRLRLRDAQDQRTDPAPISETEFRRPIPGAMPGGAGAGPARRPCR
jgi:hypothetical protein